MPQPPTPGVAPSAPDPDDCDATQSIGPSLSDVLRDYNANADNDRSNPTFSDGRLRTSSVADGESSESGASKTEVPEEGTAGTIKHLYEGPSRCRCCINWVEQYPDDLKDSTGDTEESKSHALVLRHKKCHDDSKDKPLELHSIKVQSQQLKIALCDILQDYPGVTPDLGRLIFETPFEPFFHCWDSFTRSVHEAEQTNADYLRDLKLLHGVVEAELRDSLDEYSDLIKCHVMTYEHLWTLYPPGELVLEQENGRDGRYRAYKITETDYSKKSVLDTNKTFVVRTKYIDWDGQQFGYLAHNIKIPPFKGTRKISELRAVPIGHHPSGTKVLEELITRGNKIEKFKCSGHKAYHGTIKIPVDVMGEMYYRSHPVEGRIVIDPESFFRHNSQESLPIGPLDDTDATEFDERYEADTHAEQNPLSRDQLILCHPVVRGYCLTTKDWAIFDVDGVNEIEWNDQSMTKLVIPENRKKLLLAMTDQHRTRGVEFDDVVKGKGRGLVMLFTGAPGTGKTLTAESIADHLRLPLYSLSAGDLGERMDAIEEKLKIVFEIVAHWNAVLLLDEADVFMEERNSTDLSRNRLVAIFLRMLEYFKGILILTTNRVVAFDAAFQSRIHLTLHYTQLNSSARKAIWGNFLQMTNTQAGEEELQDLSNVDLNGRQIKNIAKMARLLAHSSGETLRVEHVKEVISFTQAETKASLGSNIVN